MLGEKEKTLYRKGREGYAEDAKARSGRMG